MTILDELLTQHPNLVDALDDTSPYYQIWKSTWNAGDKARDLFFEENGELFLRVEPPEGQTLTKLLVRSEYLYAYNDARLVYADALAGQEVRSFVAPRDKFPLQGKAAR